MRFSTSTPGCRHVARRLQAYLDGELHAPDAEAVAVHLEECRRCGLAEQTYVSIKIAVALAPRGQPPTIPTETAARLEGFARGLDASA